MGSETQKYREVAVKVYVATAGAYSDFRIEQVFAREEHAREYSGKLADGGYEEREVLVALPERRVFYRLNWAPAMRKGREGFFPRRPPVEYSPYERDVLPSVPAIAHRWYGDADNQGLEVEGWDLERVRKVYSEQRAIYLARQEGIS